MSLATVLVVVPFLVIVAGVVATSWRLYLHPLASVPGPKLAALSTLYEAYFDLIRKGELPWQLKKLHEQYGPIVRIGPSEVHIDDTEFILEAFSGVRTRLDKHAPHRHQLGVPNASVSTVPHALHQLRRGAIAPFLSASLVASTHCATILTSLENVSAHLENAQQTGTVVDLRALLWYMATDIVTDVVFPEGTHLLDAPVFQRDYYNFQKGGQSLLLWFKHFPVLWTVFRSLPPTWIIKMEPQAAIPMNWEIGNKKLAKDILRGSDNCDKNTIIHHLYNSNLSEDEKGLERVWQESTSLMGAGGETVANVICTTIFYVLRDGNVRSRLGNELESAFPDVAQVPSLSVLLKLPYLGAVVQEGLRKAIGIISRFIRVNPDETTIFQSYKLPPGISISYSAFIIHNNADNFPEPGRFMPERWLDEEGCEVINSRRRLLFTFGTGTRRCLGEHLATAEIIYTLAILFRRFKLELYDTSEGDIEPEHDAFMPLPTDKSKGVRVIVN